MKKTLQKSSLFFIGMLISLIAFTQTTPRSITFQTIPTGAYGKGSSIAALFTPAGAYPVNNTTFNLYLSDADGNFNSTASNTPIGSAQTHYITFINGLIPTNASASNTYKLKITAVDGSGGVLATATSSFSINIQNTTGTNGNSTSQTFTSPADASPFISYSVNSNIGLFGRCVASSDDVYVQNNTSTSVSLSVKNEFDGTTITAYNNDAFVTQNQNINVPANQKLKLTGSPQKVHYRFFQTITDAAQSNTISTKAYFFMNNDLSAPFSALLNVVCYDLGSPGIFTFKTDIDPTRVGSAFFNYPGNIYTAKWDDNSANYVTSIQDIVDKAGLLTHPYSESSCGKNVIASGQTIYNSFGPSMTVAEPSTCSQTQEALTPIQIFPKPKISYTGPTKGCVGAALTFTNTSIISPQGSKTVAGCTTPNVLFYWFVDGVQAAISTDFTTSSLSLGNHTIQLAPFTGGTTYSCTPAPYETLVCIEAAPPANAASFALIDVDNIRNLDTTICPANSPFLVVNKSTTLTSGTYCSALEYNWKLTGPAGFTEINTTVSSTSPNFTVPSLTIKGDYTLTLNVSNPCGTSNTFTRKITVLERPVITTQPTNLTVCDGLNTTFTAVAAGSNLTYKWQVKIPSGTYTDVTNTGVYSGATTASLTITGGTVSMNGYKYQLIVSGSCTPAVTSNEVTLTVNPRPTSVISGSTTVCANLPATISIALTGTAPWNLTYSDGTTSTSISTSSSTYTFSVSLATTKTYTVTSLTDANCTATIGDRTGSAVITVNPLPTITGTLNACVGSTTQLSGSATADATTPWSSASTGVATISNTGLVTGISSGTSVITYKNSNGCIITATVTINPLPTVSIPNTPQSLCKSSGSPSGSVITPTATTTISTYQWYSNTTASNTGGTQVATTNTFTPPNTNAGELYYYVTVTNNNGCIATSNVSGSIKVYSQPTITPLPTSTSYCINAGAATLTPTITNGGYGTLSYQWYSNTTASTTGATLIPNETSATYTPTTTVAGVKYYYVIATNGGPTSASNCNTLTSNFAEIKVYATPTIPTDPVTATYCATATPTALTVPSASAGGYGTATYQWYSNTTASTTGGTLVASTATYTPNISNAGTTYYFVNVSNGATGGAATCNNLNSGIATITVHPLPVITSATFATQSLCISSTATSMTASATTATGTIASYQWFSNINANNTGGTLLTGETNATFTPPTNATGTTYYYCEITNSWGCKAVTAISGAIKVYAAATISAQPIAAEYCVSPSAQATLLSVTAATNAPGSLTYKWYSNTSNSNSGGSAIGSATNATYRPAITTAGATYYYVEVGNGGPVGCATTTSNAVLINVYSAPTISVNLTSSNYCKDAAANALSTTANNGGVGTLTYQWYENTTASTATGSLITGVNSATYTPSTSTVGAKYYYVVITNGGPTSTCNTITSAIATINVYAAPTIITHPITASYCKDNTVTPLTVGGATTGGLGTLSYQWYSNSSNTNTGGTTITNTTTTYTPLSNTPGTYYYYVEVRNGATGGATACNTTPSNVATITIHPLPVITSANFTAENVCVGTTATSMTASATTTTGTITGYQWYKNSTNSYTGATQIANETNATFTPPTTTTGTTYYFCEITNSWGCKTNTPVSGAINVYAAPVITSQPTGATYCQNVTSTPLSVTATSGGLGTPTYQWYSNPTNSNSSGTLLTGATSATYTPSTSTVGTTYYYVTINNGGGAAGCSILASNAVAIVVNDLPVINAISLGTQTLCLNATPSNLSVTASTSTGTISSTGYQWYSNATNSTSGASLIASANTSTYTPPTNIAGTKFYFTVITNSFNCTTTTTVSGAINVNSLPTITAQPSISSQTKCLNDAFTPLSVSATAGSGSILKYEWYSNTTNSTTGGTLVATNTSSAITNSYTPMSSSAGALYYYVIVYNTNGCQIISNVSAPFTVNDLPSISVQPSNTDQTACLNTATTDLTVSASAGSGSISTYTWYKTNSLTGSPIWTVAATNTSSSTTNTYTPPSTTVGTLYYYVIVTNSNSCTKSSLASGSVTINPVAIINNQTNTYCSGTPFSRTLTTSGTITVPVGTTYSWNAPVVTGGITGGAPGTAQATLNGTLTNPSNTPQTATYTVTPRTGNCDGATFTYTVTINPKATITVPAIDACSGSAFAFTPAHGTNGNIIPANTTYTWTTPTVTGGITGGASASGQTGFSGNLTNPTNAQKTATYTLTPTSPVGPCTGDNFTIVVNVNAKPSIANKTQTICSGDAFSITPSNAGAEIVPANTTYTWTVVDNTSVTGESNNITPANSIGQPLTNNSNLVQTVVYTVTPVSGDVGFCSGTPFTITVTVNPKPSISAKTVTACSNELFTTTITNGTNNDIVPNGITYTWSVPIVTGNMTGGAAGNAALSVSGNLTNPTSVSQTATYTVRPIVPGTTSCTGPDFTVIATIKPKAIISVKSAVACSNDAFTFTLSDGVSTDVIPTGTTYSWSSPTVTGGLTGGAAGNAQAIVGGTLSNPSNSAQTATYSIIANSNNCLSTAFAATATVYTRPLIITQNVQACSGTAFNVPLSNGGGNILPTNTTYTWTVALNNNVSGASDVNAPATSISQTLTNNTNTDQLVVYTVTPTSGALGNCVGLPFTVNVTVKPKPFVTPQTEPICSGNNFTNAPTNGNGNIIPTGTTYTWTNPVSSPLGAITGGSTQAAAQTQVRQLLTNTTNAPGTLTYTVTPSANSCSGSSYQLIVNVNPKPTITAMSSTICSSETFTAAPVNNTNGIVPANTTYIWTVVDNPNITGESNVTTASINISQTLVNTSNIAQTIVYTVTPTSGDAGNCIGNSFTVSVLVNPQPSITAAQAQIVCSGTAFNIAPVNNTDGIVPTNTKYTWANPIDNPVGSITGQSAQLVAANSVTQLLNNVTNTPATITYTVTPIAGTCTGPNFTAVITINPKPAINAQARTICSDELFTVSPVNSADGIVPNNTTYTWPIPVSNPIGAVTGGSTQTVASANISQRLTNTTNAAATLTYSVTPKSGAAGSCPGTPFNVVVNVNAKPVIGNQTREVCSGTAFNLPLVNGGSTIIPANTTYTWFVSTNNNNITGQSDINVDQSSIGQTLVNNTNVAQQITYTITPKSGATGNCIGSTFLLTVTVNPKPSITTQTQTICSNGTFTILPVNGGNLIVPANTTYTWPAPTNISGGAISGGAAQLSSVSSISQLLTNNSNSQGVLRYIVTPTSGATGTCPGAPFNVEITVSPKPILTSTLTPPAICNATNFSYNPISPTDGVSWIWTRNTITGITNTAGTGTGVINETLINTSANPITVPYVFALTTYGCPNTQTVNVIVFPTPQLTSLLTLPAQCSGTPFYYNPTSATIGTSYTWSRASIAGISNPATNGSGAISETLTNTSPNPIVVNYVYTLTANGCTNQQTVSVTIDPLPIANFSIGGLRADCGPTSRTLINSSSVNSNPLTNGTFTWGIDIIRNGGAVPVYSLINTNYTTQVNYTFTNTGIRDSLYPITLTAKSPNGCLNTYRDTITIHPDARIDLKIGTTAACAPFNAVNSINVINKTDPSPDPTINLFSSYKWTIRDKRGNILSNTISPNPPNYTITNADDTLHIALKVNSLYGCRPDSVNRIVYTYQNPIVNFTVAPQNSCTMLSTQAVNTSYIGPNRTTSSLRYAWYANGSLLSNAGVPGTFNLINNSNTRDSIYTIKLVISETVNNCKDSSSVGNLIVYPKPKAIFTVDKANEVCTTIDGVNSSINNSSLFKNGTVPQYKWSVTYNNLFDTARAIVIDSTTAPFIAAKPNFKFKDAKGTVDTSYNINMMIYTVDGCIDTLTKSIKINRRPNVDFTVPVEGCGIYIVNPTDNTTNFPNDSLQRQWTVLPMGGLSLFAETTKNPYVIFPVNTTANSIAYKIKQTVTSLAGCIDSLNRFTTIHPKPTASFAVGKIDSCGPWTKTIRNTSDPKNGLGINAITSRWEVRKDNIIRLNTSAQNLTYTFTNTGIVDSIYSVRLFVSNPQGCLDTTAVQQITVHPNARAFFNTDTLGCAPFKIRDHIKVQDFPQANDIWRYEWRIYDRFGFLLANYDSSVLAPDYIIQNESDTVTLQLIAYSKWGCTQDIFSRQIITRPNSVKAIVTADSTICSNLPLAFTNRSYYGNNNETAGLIYDWYVNDSKVTNINSPIFIFKNNSNVSDSILYVKLVTTYTNTGCNDSVTRKITIYPAPAPNFTVTSKEICGVPVGYKNFLNESIVAKNNVYNAAWTVTNLTLNRPAGLQVLPTSTNRRFQLQFGDNPGNIDTIYAVKLTATSLNGCAADTTINISLYRRPNVRFTISNALICGESTLQLTDQTTNVPTSKVWSYTTPTGSALSFFPSVTATSPKILVPPNVTGNLVSYYIKQVALTVNGCTDSTIVQLDAKPLPTAKFGMSDTASCIDSITIKFKDESIPRTPETITGWTWDFGDGVTATIKNPVHFYNKPGTYTISLVITNNEGCSSLPTRKTLIVYGAPKALFTMPKKVCQTDTIRFTNKTILGYGTSTFASEWNFGDGSSINTNANPSHVFTKPGIFVVSLKVKADSSCTTSTVYDTITVAGFPSAGFTHQFNCVNSPVNFIDTSKAGFADTLGSWRWSFDNGSFSNQASPTHRFSNLRTYNVKLLVSGLACPNLKDSVTYPLLIDAPIASFNMSDSLSCIDSISVKFTDFSSTYAPTTIRNWNWNFGDGTTSTMQSPTHFFNKPGKYYITLTVTNNEGCTSLPLTKQLIVYGSPKAAFVMPEKVCQTDTIRFTNKTQLGYGSITFASEWNFGDGSSINTNANPSHVFTKPGIFVVSLKVKADSSCTTSTVYDTITVAGFPSAGFTHQFNCVNSPVNFIDTSKAGFADTLGSWRWSFDNGSFSNQASPTHRFSNLRTYNVKLLVSGLACPNLKDSVTYPLLIDAPIASFNMSDSLSCIDSIKIKFTDLSSTYAPTTIRNWNWNFGDGSSSTTQSPTHLFNKPGKYYITLTVTNNEGCTSLPLTKQLIVYGSPKAAFVMPKQICLTDSIPFVNTSTLGYGSTKFISYTWDFGDGIPLNYTANPTHRFKFAGKFGVRLTVRADSSCMTSTFVDSVTVIGYPKAKFGITNYCVETPIFFKDSSVAGYADKVGSWRWDFGDNSFSSVTSPVHIYNRIGTFPVKLLVSGNLCPYLQDSITIPLKIIDRRRDSVYAIKYLQYNIAQSLCALPGGNKYTWSPSTDINPIDSRCVTINVQHPKTIYKITIIDSAGCTINDRQEIWGFPGTDIFLPRAFIPASNNRDNAIFKPIYVGVTVIKYFKIYDRFGHEVFSTSDMSKYWDGTSNGVNQPMETYTWIIQGFDYNNKPVIRQGNVTLIRYQ